MRLPPLTGWNAAALVTTGASIPMVDQSAGCPVTRWTSAATVKVVAPLLRALRARCGVSVGDWRCGSTAVRGSAARRHRASTTAAGSTRGGQVALAM
jgi:hypothetical protein